MIIKKNSITQIGSRIPIGTSGSVLYIDANGKLAQDNSNFNYDDTNKRLGIGISTPLHALHTSNGIKFGNNTHDFPSSDHFNNYMLGGGTTSCLNIAVQDGSGRTNFYWNAYYNTVATEHRSIVGGGEKSVNFEIGNGSFMVMNTLTGATDPDDTLTWYEGYRLDSTGTSYLVYDLGVESTFLKRTEGGNNDIYADTYSDTVSQCPRLFIRRTGGTNDSKTAVSSGSNLFILRVQGYGDTNYKTGGNIIFQADGNFTDSSAPTRILFQTVPSGSTTATTRMTIKNSGYIGIGNGTPDAVLDVNSLASTDIVQIIQGAASQSADLLQFKNSSGVTLSSFNSAGELNLPQINDSATPTLSFGNGDTGFYEFADDQLGISVAGTFKWIMDANYLGAYQSDYPTLIREVASSTNPNIVPNFGDLDTGIGTAASDKLSLIAGGVNVLNATSDGRVGIKTVSPNSVLDVLGDTRLGDSTTNYVEVESDGDVNFVGGAGLQLGEIYYMNTTGFDTDLAAQDTWYQILGFDTNGVSNGSVTPDHTNDHLTVGKAGIYKIEFHISSRSAASNIYHFMIRINNGATDVTNIMAHRVTSVAGRVESASCAGFADLSANDTVELWVRRTDGGAVSKTITTEHVTLSCTQVAG